MQLSSKRLKQGTAVLTAAWSVCAARHVVRVLRMTPGCLRLQSGELFDFLNVRGRLHEGAARRFFQQLITGIEACHAAGVETLCSPANLCA